MTGDSDQEIGMTSVPYSDWPYIINLSNSIIGIAVLALPFCFKECGLILAVCLLLVVSWITNVTCHMLLKAAQITKKRSYEYLALHMFGIAGKFTIEVSIIGLLIGTCIAFYIIIGDIGPVILSNITGLENTSGLRSFFLVAVTLFGVLPLGMMQNLDRLSHLSAVSLSFYSCFALHVIAAAFTNFFSGVWVTKVVYWNPDGIFKCLPIIALSFACQTQLFIINESLPEPSVKRMSVITKKAVSLVSCLYILVGSFGYIAFYDDEITGDVLMNFRPTVFSEVIKLGFVISTIISFPLVIFPCRASLYTLLFAQVPSVIKSVDTSIAMPSTHFKSITTGIVALTLCIGLVVPNVEFMLAITGATMGSLICYIFPAVMAMTISSFGHGKQKLRAQFVLFVGIAILLASTYTTLSTQEKLAQQESVVKVAVPIEHRDHADLFVKDSVDGDASVPIEYKQLQDNVVKASLDKATSFIELKDHHGNAVKDSLDKAAVPNEAKNHQDIAFKASTDKVLYKPQDHQDNAVEASLDKAAVPNESEVHRNNKIEVILDSRHEPPNPREPLDQPGVAPLKDESNNDVAVLPTIPPLLVKLSSVDAVNIKTHENGNISNKESLGVKREQSSAEHKHLGNDSNVLSHVSANASVVPKLLEKKPGGEKSLPEGNDELAKSILDELRKQQEEQKLLLKEQREIVAELKHHQIEIHKIDNKHWQQDAQAQHNLSQTLDRKKLSLSKSIEET